MYIINFNNVVCRNYAGVSISEVLVNIDYQVDDTREYMSFILDRNFEDKIEREEKIREYIKNNFIRLIGK